MGQVAATLKVMPEGTDTDMEQIKKQITHCVNVQDIKETPIAFGLVALEVLVVLSDASGGTDKIEEFISKIHGVASVETLDVTLI